MNLAMCLQFELKSSNFQAKKLEKSGRDGTGRGGKCAEKFEIVK